MEPRNTEGNPSFHGIWRQASADFEGMGYINLSWRWMDIIFRESFSKISLKMSYTVCRELLHFETRVTVQWGNTLIYSFLYDRTNRWTNFPNLFWLKNEPLHISGSSSTHHQDFINCTLGTGISLTVWRQLSSRVGMDPSPARKLSSNRMTYTSAKNTVNEILVMGRGTARNM